MITKFSVKGFKTLKDFSVPLTRVSVLVGPNNCGKSNVLRALSLLGAAVRLGLPAAVGESGGPSEVMSRSGAHPLELSIEAQFGAAEIRYKIGSATTDYPYGIEELSASGLDGPGLMPVKLQPDGTAIIGIPDFTDRFTLAGAVAGNILHASGRRRNCPEPIRLLCEHLEGLVVADFSMDRLRAKSLANPPTRLD